ncbi:MAG: lamin tail domain-containing protein [Actinobacteria bacterium]|nr:lamin tail domain-containing protein [Actinomycetota bacterium]
MFGAAAVACSVVLVATTSPAEAVSPDIVVSQVYGGGGNTGATYTRDYIELYNRGTTVVSLAGWSVQYASATGSTWLPTALAGSLAPGTHYLISENGGTGGTTPLPTPDAAGTTNLSATAGKVALVTSTTALTCGAVCHAAPGVRDYVGYGTAGDYEGPAAAPAGSNTNAVLRAAAGGIDTDSNAADFTAGAPVPRNTTSSGGVRIRDIQGAQHLSPLNGQTVTAVPGIVTATSKTGFWMQDPNPDANPATSEGIVVYTTTVPTVTVGTSVTVSGTVSEYRPGGTSGTANLTTTELAAPTITVVSTGNPLPPATLVGSGGRVPPATVIDNLSTGDAETRTSFDAVRNGIDFWESMEGMRVEVDNAAVVGPTTTAGELPVVPAGSGTRTARGGIVAQAGDFNPERLILDNALVAVPTASVGDTLAGATVGVLDYSFGAFKLQVTATPTVTGGGLARETTRTPTGSELGVATFNVENLAPTDPATKFSRLATAIVQNLAAPDLLTLEEVQDNSGATNDGVVAADVTLTTLVNAITAAGGPTYQWREIDPVNNADGGQPGGNIRVVYLYRTDRGLAFVDRPGGTATAAEVVSNVGGKPQLSLSPGRVDPTNSAWSSSRKPLAAEFTFHGRTLFVVANHFNSKGGDDPLFGHRQPPVASSETQRHSQATVVCGFVDSILAIDPTASVVVLGDLNDFDFSQTANILVGPGTLTDLPRTLPLADRYTYDYQGNSEVLDHILLSTALLTSGGATGYDYDVVHVNSEFADQVSDHEPQVARLLIP